MYVITALLLLSPKSFAQILDLRGENERFAMRATFTDHTGRGEFVARSTTLDAFAFEFRPRRVPRSPRDFYFAEIFGAGGLRLETADVRPELDSAAGLDGQGGYYVRIALSERGRARVNGYDQLGVRIGSFGVPEAPHFVKLLHADDDLVLATSAFSLRHRAVAGDFLFRESILECARVLDPSSPDREEGATFD